MRSFKRLVWVITAVDDEGHGVYRKKKTTNYSPLAYTRKFSEARLFWRYRDAECAVNLLPRGELPRERICQVHVTFDGVPYPQSQRELDELETK